MKLYHSILLMAIVTQALDARSPSSHSDLEEWFACSDKTFTWKKGKGAKLAECAVFKAPLCYPGICEAPKHVDSTVDIFVKRIPAVKKPETAPNFLLFKGNMEAATPDCKAYYDLTSVVPAFY